MMAADWTHTNLLAPLQRVMLADSLATDGAGRHVEQVEIIFSNTLTAEKITAAWRELVEQTEALRIGFVINAGNLIGWEFASESEISIQQNLPISWKNWLSDDSVNPLLISRKTPWRVVYWPAARRFVWTFHHALLDGRSITRILRNFIKTLAAEPKEFLARSLWREPTSSQVALAEAMFCGVGDTQFSTAQIPERFLVCGRAIRCLGDNFTIALGSSAVERNVTIATILTWAWGQVLIEFFAEKCVIFEQVRCGAPQVTSAGFIMNTLPVLAKRDESVAEMRSQLQTLRAIESVSLSERFRDSSVLMIEHGTLDHWVRDADGKSLIESVTLHESEGDGLMATASILPNLRLEVEGPGRFELLEQWVLCLKNFIRTPALDGRSTD